MRRALASQVEHDLAHHVHAHRVEAAHGLVHDQHVGLVQDGGDELRLLLHALRELVRLLLPPVGEPEPLEPGAQPRLGLLAAHALDGGHEDELLLEHHARVEPALLGHVADAVARRVVGGLAEDLDRAGVGAQDVHDHPQRGRLAGAVRPQQAEDAAPGNLEGQVLHRHVAGEGLPYPLEDDGLVVHGFSASAGILYSAAEWLLPLATRRAASPSSRSAPMAYGILPILAKVAYAAGVATLPAPRLALRHRRRAHRASRARTAAPAAHAPPPLGDRLRLRLQLDRLLPRPRADPGVRDRPRPVHLPRARGLSRRPRGGRAPEVARPPRRARGLRRLRAHRGRRPGGRASAVVGHRLGASRRPRLRLLHRAEQPLRGGGSRPGPGPAPRAGGGGPLRRSSPSPTGGSPSPSTRGPSWPSPASASSRRSWP